MSSRRETPSKLGKRSVLVSKMSRVIVRLPEPPQAWEAKNHFDSMDGFKKLARNDLLEVDDSTVQGKANKWRVKDHVYEAAKKYYERPTRGVCNPCCGNTGFKNLGDVYECKVCGDTFEEFLEG